MKTLTLLLTLIALPLACAQDGLPPGSQPPSPAEVDVDDSAGQPAQRTGLVGTKRKKRTSIENKNELDSYELFPKGYTYDVGGEYSEYYLEATAITLTAPDGSRTIRLNRLEGAAQVSRGLGGSLTTRINGVERALRANPSRRLEELLRGEVRARGDGTFVVRGWAIDVETHCGVERTLLLDGIQMLSEQGSGWATQHYNRNGKHEEFEYTFDAPAAGKYALSARVVTTSWKQHLLVAANGAEEPIDIALPFTVGMWDKTEPVEVKLVKGKNVLRFSREGEVKGLTIKDFTFKPLN